MPTNLLQERPPFLKMTPGITLGEPCVASLVISMASRCFIVLGWGVAVPGRDWRRRTASAAPEARFEPLPLEPFERERDLYWQPSSPSQLDQRDDRSRTAYYHGCLNSRFPGSVISIFPAIAIAIRAIAIGLQWQWLQWQWLQWQWLQWQGRCTASRGTRESSSSHTEALHSPPSL